MNYERLTRRDMLRVMGAAALLVGSGGCTSNDTKPLPSPEPSKQVFPDATPNATKTPNITAAPTEKPTPKPIEKGPKPEDLNKTDVIFHAKQGVIFTFDDDYSPEWTEQVADIALRKGVPLAFGPIGKNVEKHPETFQNLVNHGFAIFNHTMDHISLAPKKYKGIAILDKNGNYNLEYYEKEYARIRSQIERAEATILDITGKKPLPLLRPPGGLGIFGTQNPILHQVAFDLGYKILMWSDDSNGWRKYPHTNEEAIKYTLNNIRKNLVDKAIVLQHPEPPDTLVFPKALDLAVRKKLKIESLDQLAA